MKWKNWLAALAAAVPLAAAAQAPDFSGKTVTWFMQGGHN